MRFALPAPDQRFRLAVPTAIVGEVVDAAGCPVQSWSVAFVDASIDLGDATPVITSTSRGSSVVAIAPPSLRGGLAGSVVIVTKIAGQWYILSTYCRGPAFEQYNRRGFCYPAPCVAGVEATTESPCTEIVLAWEFDLAFLIRDSLCCMQNGKVTLEYVAQGTWQSAAFTCVDEQVQWVLNVSGSTATLRLLRTDGELSAAGEIAWTTNRWCCTCPNRMNALCPSPCAQKFGPSVCLRPSTPVTIWECGWCETTPHYWVITVEDNGCEGLSGVYVLGHDTGANENCRWAYRTGLDQAPHDYKFSIENSSGDWILRISSQAGDPHPGVFVYDLPGTIGVCDQPLLFTGGIPPISEQAPALGCPGDPSQGPDILAVPYFA